MERADRWSRGRRTFHTGRPALWGQGAPKTSFGQLFPPSFIIFDRLYYGQFFFFSLLCCVLFFVLFLLKFNCPRAKGSELVSMGMPAAGHVRRVPRGVGHRQNRFSRRDGQTGMLRATHGHHGPSLLFFTALFLLRTGALPCVICTPSIHSAGIRLRLRTGHCFKIKNYA